MAEIDIAARAARQQIMQHANLHLAADDCNRIVDKVLDELNACGHTIATSLLCRALIIHAMADTAATWWAMEGGLPTPVTFAAMWSLCRDLPPQLIPESWDDRDPPPLR